MNEIFVAADLGTTCSKVLIYQKGSIYPEYKIFRTSFEEIKLFFDGYKNISNWSICGCGSHKFSSYFASFKNPPKELNEMETVAKAVSSSIEHKDNFTIYGENRIFSSYLIVSLGTGVSFCVSERSTSACRHVGGSALGGGSLMGLAKLILKVTDFSELINLAELGDSRQADVMVSDLYGDDGISNLESWVVASSFGKVQFKEDLEKADLAASLVKMIIMGVAVQAGAILKSEKLKTCVLVGGFLKRDGLIALLFNKAVNLFNPGITTIFPKSHQFFGAYGAALSMSNGFLL